MNYLITHNLQGNLILSTINLTKYLEILFDFKTLCWRHWRRQWWSGFQVRGGWSQYGRHSRKRSWYDSLRYYNTENIRGKKSKFKILGSQFQIFLPPAADKFAKLDPLSVFVHFEHYPSSCLMCLGLYVAYLRGLLACITCLTFASYMFYLCPLLLWFYMW